MNGHTDAITHGIGCDDDDGQEALDALYPPQSRLDLLKATADREWQALLDSGFSDEQKEIFYLANEAVDNYCESK